MTWPHALFVELSVLQTIQEARFVGEQPDPPLTTEQIQLVADFGQLAPWLESRTSNAFPGDLRAALEFVTTTDETTLARAWPDMPDRLVELAEQLMADKNSEIWKLLPNASKNDTFLGPDGEYRPRDGWGYTTTGDSGHSLSR